MSNSSLNKLMVNLDRIEAKFKKMEWLDQAAAFVKDAAVGNAPFNYGYLQQHIFYEVERKRFTGAIATVYTDVEYAPYVELGTGRRGAMNHEGISPEVHPTYTMHSWWIHESQLDVGVAAKYHFPFIDTPEGRFYKCEGQPAQPFMYPALKDNEARVIAIAEKGIEEALK